MSDAASYPAAWLERTLAKEWSGACPQAVAAVKGDASNRRFWRVRIAGAPANAPATAILVDLGPDDFPPYVHALGLLPEAPAEPPYLNVHRFLASIQVAVPGLYHADPGARLLLIEDVGDLPLLKAAREGLAKPASLYRLALDELLLIQVEGTRRLGPDCIASRLAYDRRLLLYELEEFLDFGLEALAAGGRRAALRPELEDLAGRLDRLPRIFSHRDYHGDNLFVQGNRIRVLDFQDALCAPAAQDLAVLLTTRDTLAVVDAALESRLLDYHMAGLGRRHAETLSPPEFLESYRLCVLQHALKAIGRFNRLDRAGKTGYAAYLPYAAAQARRMLAQRADFPALRAVFGVEGLGAQ